MNIKNETNRTNSTNGTSSRNLDTHGTTNPNRTKKCCHKIIQALSCVGTNKCDWQPINFNLLCYLLFLRLGSLPGRGKGGNFSALKSGRPDFWKIRSTLLMGPRILNRDPKKF